MKKLKEAGIALGLGLVSCNLYILFSQRLFDVDLLRNTHSWVGQVPVAYQYYASLSHFGVSECLAAFPAVVMVGIILGLMTRNNPLVNGLFASAGFCICLIFSSASFEPVTLSLLLFKVLFWCALSMVATVSGRRLRNEIRPTSAH